MTVREIIYLIVSFFECRIKFIFRCWILKKILVFYSVFPFFVEKMGSLDMGFFRSLSVEKVLIKIWDFSNHVHHVRHIDTDSCNCRQYLNLRIEAAREQWRENFIYFDTAIYRFQFHRKELIDIMAIDN